ncbi:FAD-dependent oxidoreductase [Streptomyces sp. ISL-100]|nr:FAD-dependent oxidoreductase [Streptomyces sp. ISL-100]
MGSNTKLQLQFTDRPWYANGSNGSSYADTGYQSTWEVTRAQASTTGILNNYTGAEAATALIDADPSAAARTFLTQIEPVLPGITARWNGKATLDAWVGNKWAKGSYSYYRVGQNTAFGGAESEREGNAHFAGEHTTQEWQGWLQGAVFTGQRAVKEILTDLKD